jgi:AraC-like DNA-binding protein
MANNMSEITWQRALLSPCETFHLIEGKPLYNERFTQVMKYHAPGLAPVKDVSGAYHINIKGQPAYSTRFIETFGFYEDLAAVNNAEGWFHIKPIGEALYNERYSWCGNFQENFCPVKNKMGLYFHINQQGKKAYQEQYSYVGDFKDGIAVVCNQQGLHSHINYDGQLIHQQWFLDLDIFHKGYARAKDKDGWHHINKSGQAIYLQRYAQVEPFYNGVARVETCTGALITINTQGKKINELRAELNKPWQALSGDMVGFWRTEIIAAAVRLNLFNYLPGTSSEIASRAKLPEKYLTRLLRALWELNLIQYVAQNWYLTEKGKLLSPQKEKFLAAAAVMWSDVNSSNWKALPTYIQQGYDQHHTLFKATAADKELEVYHRAIDSYTAQDFSQITTLIDWQPHQKIIGIGRSANVLLNYILRLNSHIQGFLLGEAYVLKYLNKELLSNPRFCLQQYDILQAWPQKADAILLPKILHYWPDHSALTILKNAYHALLPHGKIYLFEMLLDEETPNGSLLDINMYVESGGQLRFLTDWQSLFAKVHLQLQENKAVTPWLNLLVLVKVDE